MRCFRWPLAGLGICVEEEFGIKFSDLMYKVHLIFSPTFFTLVWSRVHGEDFRDHTLMLDNGLQDSVRLEE